LGVKQTGAWGIGSGHSSSAAISDSGPLASESEREEWRFRTNATKESILGEKEKSLCCRGLFL